MDDNKFWTFLGTISTCYNMIRRFIERLALFNNNNNICYVEPPTWRKIERLLSRWKREWEIIRKWFWVWDCLAYRSVQQSSEQHYIWSAVGVCLMFLEVTVKCIIYIIYTHISRLGRSAGQTNGCRINWFRRNVAGIPSSALYILHGSYQNQSRPIIARW